MSSNHLFQVVEREKAKSIMSHACVGPDQYTEKHEEFPRCNFQISLTFISTFKLSLDKPGESHGKESVKY